VHFYCVERNAMLRITITDGPAEQRWILQGRLVAPWVAELETSWKNSHHRRDSRKCIVDVSDVTLIDDRGEKALLVMRRAGAEFIACGVYTRHVVELIESQCKCR
jgi:hypothetical protein